MQHHARKRFGQNFLVDEQAIQRCISSIAPLAGELIIEVGPGQQALTAPLADAGAELCLVEIDRDLAARLENARDSWRVVNQDALKVDFAALAQGRPYRLVGNLPYNISTPLLFHVLDQSPAPQDMHFMLQKEVVERMHAPPGSRDYGRLSLMCQNLCQVQPLFEVGSDAFEPRPKVDSTFVRLIPRSRPLVQPDLNQAFARVVRQAFSMRRKTLRNSMKPIMSAESIESCGIDAGLRPEQLPLEDYAKLAATWQKNQSSDS